MLTLNLISHEQKKEIKTKRFYESLKRIYFVFALLICLTGIIFLCADLILKNVSSQILLQNSLISKNSKNFDDKISEINQQINSASEIQKTYKTLSPILKDLAEKMPENIQLSSISISIDKSSIQLKGTAKHREDLLNLKRILEDSDKYNNIVLPLQTILRQKNISFDIAIGYKN